MAYPTITLLDSGTFSSVNSFNTNSVIPGANHLIVVAVRTSVNSVNITGVSGDSLTWSSINSNSSGGSPQPATASAWQGIGASPSTGALAVTLTSTCAGSYAIYDISPVNATPIVATNVQVAAQATGALTFGTAATMNAYGSSNNIVMAVAATGSTSSQTFTAGSSMTAQNTVGGNLFIEASTAQGSPTTVNANWSVTSKAAMVAFEVSVNAGGGGGVPIFRGNQNLNGLGVGGPFFANPIGRIIARLRRFMDGLRAPQLQHGR